MPPNAVPLCLRTVPFLLALAASAHAQATGALDVAGTHIKYADGDGTSVFSVAPSLRWESQTAAAVAQGSWASFADGAWSAQAALAGSWYGPVVHGLRPELGASASGTTQEEGDGTNQLAAGLRVHYARARLGFWVGGGLGRAHDGATARSTAAADLGAWARIGAGVAALTIAPSAVGDSLRYTDVTAAWRWERGALDASAFAGWRTWSRPSDADATTWAGVNVAVWLSRHLALAIGAGGYPADWAQSLPSGRFLTASLRLATRRPGDRRRIDERRLPPSATPFAAPLAVPVVPAFEAVSRGGGQWTLRLRAPQASRVEIMGDFTRWEPVVLTRGADGRWSATVALAPGAHRINVRVDGGEWGVPPNVPVLQDEFSGAVGVLVIEK